METRASAACLRQVAKEARSTPDFVTPAEALRQAGSADNSTSNRLGIPTDPLHRLEWVSRWTSRSAFSLADQGLASGGHFLLNLALVRWLSPADYGAFAVSFALFLAVACIHNALVLEPMSIVGPAKYQAALTGYLKTSIRINALVALALAAILLLLSAAAGLFRSPLESPLRGLAIATPPLLTFWFLRRACYLRTQPRLAFRNSLQYAIALLCGAAILRQFGWLSPFAATALMGLASGLSGLLCWPRLAGSEDSSPPPTATVCCQHWGYARWFVGSTIAYWLASSLYLPLIGALAGLDAAGAYRAMESLLQPMSQTLTGFGLLLLPTLARRGQTHGAAWLRRVAVRISLGAALLVAAYVLGIVLLGANLVAAVYGRAHYTEYLPIIPYLGGALIIRAISDTGLGTAAKASGRPQVVFWSVVASSVVTLSAGVALAWAKGVSGAAVGWFMSASVYCAVTIILFRRADT